MNATLRGIGVLTVLALGACAALGPAPKSTPAGPAAVSTLNAAQLLTAVQADADRIDQSKDPAEHKQLLAAATLSAQQCLAQYPNTAACQYGQAQVQGLTARERPLEAVSLLKDMLASLTKAESLDPALDHAGPARLTAVVLLRAPPWPLGPGDVDSAVTAAQRAVKLDPAYPPNLITLAQAQAKSGGTTVPRATYAKAQAALQAWTGPSADAAADRSHWQQQIEQGLHDLQ